MNLIGPFQIEPARQTNKRIDAACLRKREKKFPLKVKHVVTKLGTCHNKTELMFFLSMWRLAVKRDSVVFFNDSHFTVEAA